MVRQRALVWFRRDLRVLDHAPLVAAQACTDALALFVIEPEWLESADCDASHVDFALGCLTELRANLASKGLPLLVRIGSAIPVLTRLHAELFFTQVFSHGETGPGWTYTRDIRVATWCRSQQVQWQEFRQTGVVRRLRTRTGWARRWQMPIVDEKLAMKAAKDRLYGLRQSDQAREQAEAVQARHGSRKSGLPPTGLPTHVRAKGTAKAPALLPTIPSAQGDLFT